MHPQPKLAPVASAVKPELVAKPRPKRSFAGIFVVLTIVALAAASYYFYQSRSKATQQSATAGVRTIKVSSGSASPLLRVTGSTSARIYSSINAPVMMGPDAGRGLLLKSIAKSGVMVRAGE